MQPSNGVGRRWSRGAGPAPGAVGKAQKAVGWRTLCKKMSGGRDGYKFRPLTSCSRPPVSWPDPRLAAALAGLASRVKRRYVAETVRLALIWGLAATTGLLTILYLTAPEQPVLLASLAGFLVAAVVAAWRYTSRPDALDVTRLADTLGLEGRAVTAFRLLQQSNRDGWEEHALAAGIEDCAVRDREGWPSYPVVPSRRAWQGALVLAAVLVVLAFLPNPLAGYWSATRQERAALAAAREQVEAVVERVAPVELAGGKVFSPEEQAELAAQLTALQEAGSRDEAVRRIEEAEAVLAEKAVEVDPAAGEDLQRLAETWRAQGGDLAGAGEALAAGDTDALAEAMEKLAGELTGASAAARQEAGRELLEDAEVVSDAGLRQALRQAGRRLMDSGPPGADEAGEALAALGRELAETAAASRAAGQMAGAAARLDAVARALAGGGDAAAIAAAAGGTPGSSTSPAGSAAGAAVAGNTTGVPGTGSRGAGSGSLATTAAGSSTGQGGSGSGDATGEGSGSGSGDGNGQGSGTGGGGRGAGTSGGGLDMIYVPSRLGGEGKEVGVSGEVREGEAGTEVTLESSPTTLGAVRPYAEVYPQYLQQAQESLSQNPLPPALADLVRDYFTSLDPVEK